MALRFDGKRSGTASPKTRNLVSFEDEKDWDPKMEDVQVSSRELPMKTALLRYDDNVDPVTDLKRRLSRWGKSIQHPIDLVFFIDIGRPQLPRGQEGVQNP